MCIRDRFRFVCFFIELWNIVAGHTVQPGIQQLVYSINEFGLLRCQCKINDYMPACQVISFHCTVCTQVKSTRCSFCWDTFIFWTLNTFISFFQMWIGYAGPYYLRESVLYMGTRAVSYTHLFYPLFIFGENETWWKSHSCNLNFYIQNWHKTWKLIALTFGLSHYVSLQYNYITWNLTFLKTASEENILLKI